VMPKAKPTEVIVHRIELQEHERDTMDMVAASYAAKNIAQGIGSLLEPFTKCTLWGAAVASTIWGVVIVERFAKSEAEKESDSTPFYPRGADESAASYRERTSWAERANYYWEVQRDHMLGIQQNQ